MRQRKLVKPTKKIASGHWRRKEPSLIHRRTSSCVCVYCKCGIDGKRVRYMFFVVVVFACASVGVCVCVLVHLAIGARTVDRTVLPTCVRVHVCVFASALSQEFLFFV